MMALPGLGSMRRQLTASWSLIVACSALTGCQADSTEPSLTRGTTLVMLARRLSLTVGDTTSVGLTLELNGGVVQRTASTGTGPDWTSDPATIWLSRDTNIVTVNSNGFVAARASGTAWIVAQRGGSRDSSPVAVTTRATTMEAVMEVSTGGGHTCALASGGTAWCWGSMWNAATGTGQRVRYSVLVSPTPVATTERFVHIDAGSDHTCALNAAGVVSCWGDNRFGQIGTTEYFEASPRAIALPLAASALSVGGDNSCTVLTDGTIRCWGTRYKVATMYSTGTSARFDSVSVGAEHVCARSSDGAVWCWGDNQLGQLGTGDRVSSTSPTRVEVGASVVQVSAGYAVTCVVDIASRTRCWGTSSSGELGLGDVYSQLRAAQVPVPGVIKSVSSGGGQTCALNADGAAYCWGGNLYGGLGIGPLLKANPQATDFNFRVPQRVLSQDGYRMIASGSGTTCAITPETSRLDCWGSNRNGQLGVGALSWYAGRRYSQRDVPTPVVRFTP